VTGEEFDKVFILTRQWLTATSFDDPLEGFRGPRATTAESAPASHCLGANTTTQQAATALDAAQQAFWTLAPLLLHISTLDKVLLMHSIRHGSS
jgi:hypothetical protein